MNQQLENTGMSKPSRPPVRRYGRCCLNCGCIFIIVNLVIIFGNILFIRNILKGNFTSDQLAAAREYETKVIALPKEWHKPATLPTSEVTEFWDAFSESMRKLELKHLSLISGNRWGATTASLVGQLGSQGPRVRPDQRTSYTALIVDFEPIIDITSQSVTLPDFVMQDDKATTYSARDWHPIIVFARLMSVVSREQASVGNYMRAFESAALPLRLLRRTEQASTFNHSTAIKVSDICGFAVDSIALDCTDTLSLVHGGELLKELRPVVFVGDHNLWKYGDTLGRLRNAAAYGYPVDLSPQPLSKYYRSAIDLEVPRYYEWLIDNLRPDEHRVIIARAQLSKFLREGGDANFLLKAVEYDSRHPDSLLYKMIEFTVGMDPYTYILAKFDPSQKMEIPISIAKAKYDLVQQQIA